MTGACPNRRSSPRNTGKTSIALDSAGSSAIFFVPGSRRSRGALKGSWKGPWQGPRGPAGRVGRGARTGSDQGAIAHIKFTVCRKGVSAATSEKGSVTPVTLHSPCQPADPDRPDRDRRPVESAYEGLVTPRRIPHRTEGRTSVRVRSPPGPTGPTRRSGRTGRSGPAAPTGPTAPSGGSLSPPGRAAGGDGRRRSAG